MFPLAAQDGIMEFNTISSALMIRQASLAFVRPKAIGTFKCHCVIPINKNGVVVVWLMQAVRGCERSKKVAGMVHSDCRHGA
jgi:hypothetical protein